MLQTVLNKLFRKVDILTNGTPGAPIYLRRWFIWPRRPENNKLVPRRYLHRFFTGDNVRDLHDHPWPFSSIILWGGYWEHSFNPEWMRWKAVKDLKEHDRKLEQEIGHDYGPIDYDVLLTIKARDEQRSLPEPEKTLRKWYGPGSFIRRGAPWTHAVEMSKDKQGNDQPCWTIIKTGIKCRSWGFHTDNGWCWWRNYHSGACVCYDNPNEDINNGRPSSTIDVSQVASGH